MKIGIVGTGGIVASFLDALKNVEGVDAIAIWCREKSIKKAREISKNNGFQKVYTDYELMLNDDEIDFIYIALPNNLHYEYSKKALEFNKNVINEKPFTSTVEEAENLIELAKKKRLFLFEAITTLHTPNYKLIKEKLAEIGEVKIISGNYSQYSSRYDAFLKGIIHPVFNPELSGGALVDINIYNIHFVMGLFGKSDEVKYLPNIAHNGIDTSGILTLRFNNFNAVCIGAKDCESESGVYIEATKGYIKVNGSPGICSSFEVCLNKHEKQIFNEQKLSNHMVYEICEFRKIFNDKNYNGCYKLLEHSLDVIKTVVEAREDAGIVFSADN